MVYRVLRCDSPLLPLAVFPLAAVCGGCILFDVSTKPVSVEKVELLTTFADIAPYGEGQLVEFYRSRREGQLKIALTSASDVAAIAADEHFNVFHDASICPLGVGTDLEWTPVFEEYEGKPFEVNALAKSYLEHPDRRASAKADRYTYELLLDLRRARRRPSGDYRPVLEPYDLVDHPQDVCLRLRGGATLGGTLQSNVVLVPAKAIADAVAVARPESAQRRARED